MSGYGRGVGLYFLPDESDDQDHIEQALQELERAQATARESLLRLRPDYDTWPRTWRELTDITSDLDARLIARYRAARDRDRRGPGIAP